MTLNRIKKTTVRIIILTLFMISHHVTLATENDSTIIYKFDIRRNIDPTAWRQTQKGLQRAYNAKADYILIHMNTYGGLLNAADSIRTALLNSKIPVLVFIDNNAASAGALIAIACDSIYMRKGASIGAATVVNQEGKPVPDKYQSYMRSMMRATAESHGKDTIITGADTTYKWIRNPKIAEAMVDPHLSVSNVVDSGKVLTFTTEEAIRFGFCEGEAESIAQVLQKCRIQTPKIVEYTPTTLDKVIGFLMNPIFQSFMIMIMMGGIYFELQTQGVGFPLAAAASAALLYFAPLYLEGLAENWEIILFAVGVILILIEVFVIPGFGVAGISGILLAILGLTLSMVDSIVMQPDFTFLVPFFRALFIVVISIFLAVVISLTTTQYAFASQKGVFRFLALHDTQEKENGYIGVESKHKMLINLCGNAYTILRPSGKVKIGDEVYDARALDGYIDEGEKVKVVKYEAGQVYVVKMPEE